MLDQVGLLDPAGLARLHLDPEANSTPLLVPYACPPMTLTVMLALATLKKSGSAFIDSSADSEVRSAFTVPEASSSSAGALLPLISLAEACTVSDSVQVSGAVLVNF